MNEGIRWDLGAQNHLCEYDDSTSGPMADDLEGPCPRRGEKLLCWLTEKPQQTLFGRFAGVRGNGAMSSATCQGLEHWERVVLDPFHEILAPIPGSHDQDLAFGKGYQFCRNEQEEYWK